jgi:hypothetical protein
MADPKGDEGSSAESNADQLGTDSRNKQEAADALTKGTKDVERNQTKNGKRDDTPRKKKHHLEFQGSIEKFRVPLQPRASTCGTRARGIG